MKNITNTMMGYFHDSQEVDAGGKVSLVPLEISFITSASGGALRA